MKSYISDNAQILRKQLDEQLNLQSFLNNSNERIFVSLWNENNLPEFTLNNYFDAYQLQRIVNHIRRTNERQIIMIELQLKKISSQSKSTTR